MASYTWLERLQALWSPENTPATFEVIPELPGAFPIEVEARSPSEIYELSESAVDKMTKSDSRLSNPKAPLDERLPEYPVNRRVEQLDFVPLQHPRDPAAMADEKVSNGLSLTPKRGSSFGSEPVKSTIAIVKDSSSPKFRKGSQITMGAWFPPTTTSLPSSG